MRQTLVALACCCFLGGCSVTAPVVAIVHDDMFVGQATGYLDRTGVITVTSTTKPDVTCFGDFRYHAARSGTGKMRCNDGATADFDFYGLSMASGYGLGQSTKGVVSFTFGLDVEEAKPYLKLPENKRIDMKEGKPLLL